MIDHGVQRGLISYIISASQKDDDCRCDITESHKLTVAQQNLASNQKF